MQIRISNPKILAFFDFRVVVGKRRLSVEQPLSLWLRCLWWRIRQPHHSS